MVKAILDGRKTQTRRLLKIPRQIEPPGAICEDGGGNWVAWSSGGHAGLAEFTKKAYPNGEGFPCPYGKSGDRLWVREAFCDNGGNEYEYKATSCSHAGSWSSPIHMPRRASRITLEVVSVRVERLQDIAAADVDAEGIALNHYYCDEDGGAFGHHCEPIERFKELWDRINGKTAPWDSNSWVWVIKFRRVE